MENCYDNFGVVPFKEATTVSFQNFHYSSLSSYRLI